MAEWEDVVADPEYKRLPQAEKDRFKLEFFENEIKPYIDPAKTDEIRHGFVSEAAAMDNASLLEGDPGQKPSLNIAALDKLAPLLQRRPVQEAISDTSSALAIPHALQGVLRGSTAGLRNLPEVPQAATFKEKAAEMIGEGLGAAPQFMGLSRLAAPLAEPAGAAVARWVAPVAGRVATKLPAALAKLLPTMAREGTAGAAYMPARLMAETGGEAIHEPKALAESAAIGAAAGMGVPAAVGIGKALVGSTIRSAQESGTFAAIRAKFPALFGKKAMPLEAPATPSVAPATPEVAKPVDAAEGLYRELNARQKDLRQWEAKNATEDPGMKYQATQDEYLAKTSAIERLKRDIDVAKQPRFIRGLSEPPSAEAVQPPAARPAIPEPEPPGAKPPVSAAGAPAVVPTRIQAPGPVPAPASPVMPKMTPNEPGLAAAPDIEKKLGKYAARAPGLTKQAQMLMENREAFRETGTLPKEVRPEFAGAPTPMTEADYARMPVSADIVHEINAKVDDALLSVEQSLSELDAAKVQHRLAPTVGTEQVLGLREASLKDAVALANEASAREHAARHASNRTLLEWNKSLAESRAERVGRIQARGIVIEGLQNLRQHLPLTERWVKTLIKGVRTLGQGVKPGEAVDAFKAAVDDARMNLFTMFSWVRDIYTNLTDLTSRVTGAAGHDVGYFFETGKMSAPYLSATFRSIGERAKNLGGLGKLSPGIDEALNVSMYGEPVKAGPMFWNHNTPVGKFYDWVRSVPPKLKSGADGQFGRISAFSSLYKDGLIEADARNLTGAARRDFMDKWLTSNATPEAVDAAIEQGNTAKFKYKITALEESFAQHPATKLLLDPWMSWNFRLVRWAADVFSLSPTRFQKLITGNMGPREIGYHMGRAAGGIGGLALLNEIYDKIDFRSMQVLKSNGNRINLSGISPIPEAYMLLALLRGDSENFMAGMRSASLPGARILSQQGGLLTNVILALNRAVQNRKFNPNTVADEMADTLNKFIPGQAVLSLVKQVIDPTVRKGLGANIPGVSYTKPPVINPTTGKPLKVEYRDPVFGAPIPVSQAGSAVPGAERVYNSLEQLHSKLGMMVYRGPKSAIVGVPAADVPDEYKQEWLEAFGKYSDTTIAPMAKIMLSMPDDVARDMLTGMNRDAAQYANQAVLAKHPGDMIKKMMAKQLEDFKNRNKSDARRGTRGRPGIYDQE